MTKLKLVIALILIVAFASGSITMAEPGTQEKTAEKFVLLLKAADFVNAEKLMDAKMKTALGGDKLSATWKTILAQTGALKAIVAIRESPLPAGYKNFLIESDFERAKKDLQVAIDPQGAVCGFFIKDHSRGFIEPPYADQSKFSEQKVTVGFAPYELDGTLSVPVGPGPFPGVVLVHGSGPHDQDETIMGLKVFRDLAWGLSSRGIAVLRYNKRSFQHAQKLAPIVDKLTVKEETIDDAVAALAVLKENSKIDKGRVFILGHSLGGMAMPRIAAVTKDASGYIIMAGSTRPLEDIIVDQFEYLYSLQSKKDPDQEKTIAALKVQAKNVKDSSLSSATPSKNLPLGAPAAYWLDLRAHDPAAEAKEITKPLLILQGEKDYQVTSKDLAGWKNALEGRTNVTFKTYADLGHTFTKSSEKPGPQDYEQPQNVAQEVIDDISAWLTNQKAR